MRKRLFTLFLLFLVNIGVVYGQSYDFSAVCSTGQTLYYKINTGTTTVEVTGFSGSYSSLIIPSTVTNGGTNYTVTAIGFNAFGNATFSTLTLPNTLETIRMYAFNHCHNLTSVTIPNSVTTMLHAAFWDCSSLTSVTIGSGLNIIGSCVFQACISLDSVTIPNTVDTLGDRPFESCVSLTSLHIPSSVTYITPTAFDNCYGLTSITVSAANPIYDSREGCNAIIETSTNKIVRGCKNSFIPDSIIIIGPHAFCGSRTGNITIPNSVVSIGELAFSNCWMQTIDIPDSVSTIGNNAFESCDSLQSLTIGSGVSLIGSEAFKNCTALERITLLCNTPPTLSSSQNTFSNVPVNIPVYVPCGSMAAYVGGSGWNNFTNLQEPPDCSSHYWDFHKTTAGCLVYYKILEDSTSVAVVHPLATDSIDGTYWHGYRRTSETLVIPDTVVHDSVAYIVRVIGSHAFEGCTGLSSVTIPNTADSIGNSAFANCTGIHSVYYNADSCRYMGEADSLVFGGDSSLYSLYIGSQVRNIPNYAFESLTGLQAIHIPNSVVSIGDWAFAYDANVTELTLGISLEHIGVGAFYGCGQLRNVVVPPSTPSSGGGTSGGWTWIGGGAFGGCSFGSFIYGGTTISAGLFSGNTSLDTVFVSDTVTTIGDSAFNGCTGLTTVARTGYTGIPEAWIPRTVRNVGNVAFGNCIAITRVRYEADSCLRMGSDTLPVFMNDSNIATLVVGEHVRWIPDYAFLGCTGLERITANSMEAPVLGVDVFRDVTDTIPVHIPCGSLASYMARWSHFTNFIEGPMEDTLIVQSANATAGSVEVLTQPTCSNGRTAVVGATANYGYHFTMWSDGVTANPRTLVLTRDTSLTALFDRNQYTVTIAYDETQGTVAGGGTYLYEDTATVSVTANYGYHFTMWSDGVTDNPRTIVVTRDTLLTALFDRNQYTLTIVCNETQGTVTGGGTYLFGDTAHVAVTANEGFVFSHWEEIGSSVPTLDTVVNGDVVLTALFDTLYYTLTLSSNNPDWGSVSGDGEYAYGTEVEITATANEGYRFDSWSDDVTENPRTVILTEDMELTAIFVEEVGIEIVDNVDVTMYPNPTTGMLNIEGEGVQHAEVFDLSGRVVLRSEQPKKIDLGQLSAGVYYVRVTCQQGMTVRKVVKK